MVRIKLKWTTNSAWGKTLQLYWVAYGAFVLGGLDARFSGSKSAWTALVCAIVLLVIGGYSLLRDFWKAQAR